MRRSPFALALFLLLCACCPALLAQATVNFSSVVIFGDSLSDTGDFYTTASKLGAPYPGPTFNYTAGRFTDGADTTPAARAYFGVWHEQLSQMLPGVPVTASFLASNGGNHAFGDATTANSTTAIPVGPATLTVRNMGQQVTDYLAVAKPTSTQLFIVFGGSNDLLQNNVLFAPATVASNVVTILQRLVTAGAVNFLVPNIPLLDVPGTALGNASVQYKLTLATQLATLQATYAASGTPFHLVQLDLLTAQATALANPAAFNLPITNLTSAAQTAGASVNPDTYLLWDGLHPTTAGHNLIAQAACSALTMTRTGLGPASLLATSSAGGPLNAVVSGAGTFGLPASTATPTGNVNFYSDTTANGVAVHTLLTTATLTSTGTAQTAMATLASAKIPQGIYTISAVYAGDANFPQGCRSNPVSVTVVNTSPGFVLAAAPASVSGTSGSTVTTTLTGVAVGSFSRAVSLSCGTLPQYVSCSFAPSTLAPGASSTATSTNTTTLTFTTQMVTTGRVEARPERTGYQPQVLCALVLLPWLYRRRRIAGAALALLVMCILTAVTGCGGGSSSPSPPAPVTHTAAAGSYTVVINGTAGTGGATAQTSVTLTLK